MDIQEPHPEAQAAVVQSQPRPKGRRLREFEAFLDRANIERGLETLTDLAVRFRGKPSGRPTNPAIICFRSFAFLYLAHGLVMFLYDIYLSLPQLFPYTNSGVSLEVLLLWPIFYAQYVSWVLGFLYFVGYFAASIYPAALSIPAYDWQEKMDKLKREGKAKATEQAAELAEAQKATLAVEGQLRAAQGMLADERQRSEAAERELRNQLDDAAQRERLLIFQRDAGDRGPALHTYEPEQTLRGRREEPNDPIEEIYGS